ncbi:MAG: hypothetical protein ACOC2U_04470 [bacterium]
MKVFDNIYEYEKVAKIGDRILLGGKGIMDGLKTNDKRDSFRVHRIADDGSIRIRKYRGKMTFFICENSYDQQIALFERNEFKKLPYPLKL